MFMKRVLESKGYTVETAKNYQQAMDALDGNANPNESGNYSGLSKYGYIFTDNQLPGGSGIDIVKKIRGPNYNTINPNIKIIFMSADISGTTKSELEGKVDLYLPKPIDMDINSRPNLEKLYTK